MGLVVVHPGNYGPLTAFDANTGHIRWTGHEGGVFASPIIVDLGGIRQIVTMTQGNVVSVSLADGALLWRYPWVTPATPSAITPILYGDTIIVSGQAMGVTALKPTQRDGKWVADIMVRCACSHASDRFWLRCSGEIVSRTRCLMSCATTLTRTPRT